MSDKIDWKFIGAREGAEKTKGYVPVDKSGNVFGQSGVTIATGFDIGQHGKSDLRRLKLSEALYKKLEPYVSPLIKEKAVEFLKKHPLTITLAQAKEIDTAAKNLRVEDMKKAYDNSPYNKGKVGEDKKIIKVTFEDLPGQAQTVIASMWFQWNNLSRKATLAFWKFVCQQDWAAAVKWLNEQKQYAPRRKLEAKLLEQLVKFDKERAFVLSINSIWHAVLIFAVLCSTSVYGTAQTAPLIFDAGTLELYKNYDKTLIEEASPLNFESGKTVTNCRDYLAEKKTSEVSETVVDTLHKSEYVDCDVLALLKQSKQADKLVFTKTSRFNYGMELFNRLDLNSFPNSFDDAADDKTSLLKNRRRSNYWKPRITNLGIVSEAAKWNFELHVVADIDADNDGKNDLILTLVDAAVKDGNYRSYQTLLVSDYHKKGVLRATEL